jgi:hypothetical protein
MFDKWIDQKKKSFFITYKLNNWQNHSFVYILRLNEKQFLLSIWMNESKNNINETRNQVKVGGIYWLVETKNSITISISGDDI